LSPFCAVRAIFAPGLSSPARSTLYRPAPVRLRSPYDREILTLAVLALGSLAAEPLYILVDTAIVGHLGRSQLAALGIAATVLGALFALFNFLQYGTTAQVARAVGAGRVEVARSLGVQALWLSLAVGAALALTVAAAAEPVVSVLGASDDTADYAVTYLRIAALGLPFALAAIGVQGYLRGVSDLRTPLVYVAAGNAANVVVEVLFVYGFDWGIAGSAWGTVLAQAGMGLAFVRRVVRDADDRAPHGGLIRRLLEIGRHIFVRTASLYASFAVATAVVARFGDAALGAHNIAFQLWVFLALVLDAVAIAGQVIVGRMLGAGETDDAYAASVRMIWISVLMGAVLAALMLALANVLPLVFTGDDEVVEQAKDLWPIFALMQPLNGAVFALDGILIGAGDVRYLMWSMLAAGLVSVAAALVALEQDWGVVGVWSALLVLILVRLATLGVRFHRRRWLVAGWAH
jgi:putative MATE family efflux protein